MHTMGSRWSLTWRYIAEVPTPIRGNSLDLGNKGVERFFSHCLSFCLSMSLETSHIIFARKREREREYYSLSSSLSPFCPLELKKKKTWELFLSLILCVQESNISIQWDKIRQYLIFRLSSFFLSLVHYSLDWRSSLAEHSWYILQNVVHRVSPSSLVVSTTTTSSLNVNHNFFAIFLISLTHLV